jgi:hypothetical protein
MGRIIEYSRKNAHLCVNSLLIVMLIIWVFTLKIDDKWHEKALLTIQFCTLLFIVIYVIDTHKLAKVQKLEYEDDNRIPVVSSGIKFNGDNKIVFILKNHKRFDVIVNVILNVSIDNHDIYISEYFNGERKWLVQAMDVISAPIDLLETVFRDIVIDKDWLVRDDSQELIRSHLQEIKKDATVLFGIKIKYFNKLYDAFKGESAIITYKLDVNSWAFNLDVEASF